MGTKLALQPTQCEPGTASQIQPTDAAFILENHLESRFRNVTLAAPEIHVLRNFALGGRCRGEETAELDMGQVTAAPGGLRGSCATVWAVLYWWN